MVTEYYIDMVKIRIPIRTYRKSSQKITSIGLFNQEEFIFYKYEFHLNCLLKYNTAERKAYVSGLVKVQCKFLYCIRYYLFITLYTYTYI